MMVRFPRVHRFLQTEHLLWLRDWLQYLPFSMSSPTRFICNRNIARVNVAIDTQWSGEQIRSVRKSPTSQLTSDTNHSSRFSASQHSQYLPHLWKWHQMVNHASEQSLDHRVGETLELLNSILKAKGKHTSLSADMEKSTTFDSNAHRISAYHW